MPNHMNNRETQDTQEFGTQAPSLLRPVGTLATRGPMKATDGGPAGVRSGNGLLHLLKTGRNQGAQHPASYHQATGANAIEHSRHSSIRSGHAQKRHTSPTLAEPALSMASEPPNVSPSLRGGMLSSASDDSGEFADEANWKPVSLMMQCATTTDEFRACRVIRTGRK
ncbi:hypothetical protein M011DRAFT_471184 [Sporormia fimetaria CBS 119925]|uniref:Uncharacterized protein n=1 Tax=Sporormia fimetaria CBS 119925 TaxID=1340428 RepID=A0A6A6V2W8_9PLEO|nr:hypothetical protein M011DRAFT_471184 [Sporormia fimetaria CBS 119925]